MSQYLVTFATITTVGIVPPGWTERWDSSSTWVSASNGDGPGDMVIQQTSTTNAHYAISLDAAGTPGTVEVLAKLQFPSATSSSRLSGVILRGADVAGSEDGYYFLIAGAYGASIIGELANGTLSSKAGNSLYGNADPKDIGSTVPYLRAAAWYFLRCKASGSNLYIKIWPEDMPEPADWFYTASDTTLTSGWVGLCTGGATAGSEPTVCQWFSVGTNGDAPLYPDAEGAARVTQVTANILRKGLPKIRVTKISAQVLRAKPYVPSGATHELEGASAASLSASGALTLGALMELAGAANGVFTASMIETLGTIKELTGASESEIMATLKMMQVHSLSGLSASEISASGFVRGFPSLSGAANSVLYARNSLGSNFDKTSILTRY